MMRVVFVGRHHDYTLIPFNAVAERHEMVGVVESAPRRHGTPAAQQRLLSWFRRKLRASWPLRPRSLRTLAAQLRAPYLFLERCNMDRFGEFLAELRPDVVCVSSLTQLLPASVLQIPRHGFLNNHPSLLPKYHGPFPWFWQYYHYEQHFGATIHRIDEGQDTGPILKQRPFLVPRGTEIDEAIRLGAILGAELMCDALDDLEAGVAAFRPQPPHNHPKARIVQRDEPLVEWESWELERVWHFLRGTRPWLDAVSLPPGKRWKIGEFHHGRCVDRPGAVGRDADGYFIAHREGQIRLVA